MLLDPHAAVQQLPFKLPWVPLGGPFVGEAREAASAGGGSIFRGVAGDGRVGPASCKGARRGSGSRASPSQFSLSLSLQVSLQARALLSVLQGHCSVFLLALSGLLLSSAHLYEKMTQKCLSV